MPGKRFRARLRYAHTRIWLLTALILVLGGFALYTVTTRSAFPQVAVGIALVGLGISSWMDRNDRMIYGVEGGQLTIRQGRVTERIELSAIQDASLVDRRAARDLLAERMHAMEEQGLIQAERDEFQRQFTRWCTVRLGLGTFKFGTDLQDGRPDGKHDLVLLRLRDGRSLVLSPIHNQDVISALNRNHVQDEESRHRA